MTSSRVEGVLSALVRGTLVAVLVSPYLIWFTLIPRWGPPDSAWAALALRGVSQALASTAGAFAGGWILFIALRALPAARRARGELCLLIPNTVPPLFLALALISFVTPFAPFPFGFGAVVVAHTWLNSGLVAVALERLERARLGGLAEAAWVMGVTQSTFWTRIAWPVARRDLATLAFFVFSLSLNAFSLPLLLQGTRSLSIEVAIYDLIRIDGRWDQALLLAGAQLLLVLGMSRALPRAGVGRAAPEPRTLAYRARPVWGWLTWTPAGLLALGLAGGFARMHVPGDLGNVADAFLTTLALGATVGALTLWLLTLVSFVATRAWFARVMLGMFAPGPAITGFALLIVTLGLCGEVASLGRLGLALALIYFAPLYRWQVHATLSALASQRRVAETLGAGPGQIFREVIWPQAAPAILSASGLAAAWASGEFALSGLLLERPLTLPQLIATEIAHYRWGAAQALLVPLALAAALPYVFYQRLARYVRS